MNRFVLMTIASCVALGFHGCSAEADTLAGSFEVLNQGSGPESGVYGPKTIKVLEDQDSYESALLSYSSDDARTIDFSTYKMVLVDIGQRSSGGYSVTVTDTDVQDNYLRATITTTVPGSSCVVTEALTNPYVFVAINTTKDILFTEQLETDSCN